MKLAFLETSNDVCVTYDLRNKVYRRTHEDGMNATGRQTAVVAKILIAFLLHCLFASAAITKVGTGEGAGITVLSLLAVFAGAYGWAQHMRNVEVMVAEAGEVFKPTQQELQDWDSGLIRTYLGHGIPVSLIALTALEFVENYCEKPSKLALFIIIEAVNLLMIYLLTIKPWRVLSYMVFHRPMEKGTI